MQPPHHGKKFWPLQSSVQYRRMRTILAVVVIACSTPGHAQTVTVSTGESGDRWLDTMQYRRIQRHTLDGTHGYAVDYSLAGVGDITMFWPRSQIHLAGRAPRVRILSLDIDGGRLRYPDVLTARSLPRVYAGILEIEKMYRADARGGIAAMKAFALVVGGAEVAPAVAPAVARLLSVRSTSRGVSLLSRQTQPTRRVTSSAAHVTSSAVGRAPAVASHSAPGVATSTAVPAKSTIACRWTACAPLRARRASRSAAGSPRGLSRALAAAGVTRPQGTAVHHIVALRASRAAPARQILDDLGVHIDDAANGVFLPARRSSPNPTGAAVHSTLHTKNYYKAVNKALEKANSAKDARRILRQLGVRLLEGGL